MADPLGKRLKHAWNAFTGNDRDRLTEPEFFGSGYSYNASSVDRFTPRVANEQTTVSSIYTTISVAAAGVELRHVRVDDDDRFLEEIPSGLNECLTVSANIDQAARAFRQDVVWSLLKLGVIAIVPVDTVLGPSETGSIDIRSMRVGKITQWYPQHVKVEAYNEKNGLREEVVLPKSFVAIVENPFYSVMNEPNSTLQRLIRKLGLLDAVDEQSSSGKLDLIIALPYTIRSEARREQAEQRRKDIEMQLKGSKYGIAYTDGTEKVTQLNRPVENNLFNQVTYLTGQLYSQLGLTEDIIKGTASEAVMLNFMNDTIEPILDAIKEAMTRTFLTKTARTQGQTVKYFRDPFKLVPVQQMAEIADKLTRNEIATANEIRSVIGWKPSKDPKADELRNSNMPAPNDGSMPTEQSGMPPPQGGQPVQEETPEQISERVKGILQNGV